ncbi:MAG: hypothetical protein CMJ94_09320 [Planctomycetes bacterium]|nr:hypothetical protein [Planctomycetota bacterium]
MLLSLTLSWGALCCALQSEAITPATEAGPHAAAAPEVPSAAAALRDWHPKTVEEWEARFAHEGVQLQSWGRLELWSDDRKTFEALAPALEAAWQAADELLDTSFLPDGAVIRVIASDRSQTLVDYWELLHEGAQRCGVAAPPAYLLSGANGMGSAHWNLPPTVLLNSSAEKLDSLPTRAVHEVAVLLAGWASSWSGYGAPEFLEEGLAGMIERRALKRPAALVYHDRAALKTTIHGYGVFAGIGEAMNDSSNAPGNWPKIIHNAVGKMQREWKSKSKRKKLDTRQRIDALLLRTHEQFARADYAYAWAVMEFLFDDQAAAEQQSNRTKLLRVLAGMRGTDHAALPQDKRSKLFQQELLAAFDQGGEELHLAFLAWAENSLPRR